MHLNRHNPALWLVIGAGIWIADSIIDAFLSHKDDLLSLIFTPTLYEIYIRLLIIGVILFAIYVKFIFNQQRQTEKMLLESESKFKTLSEKSLAGIYLIQNGIFKYVNPKIAEIFGYTVDELINKKGPKDLTLPEDWQIVEENLRKRITGETEAMRYNFRGLTRDKKTIYVEAYGSRIIYQGLPAVTGTLLDITERRQAEELVAQAKHDWEDTFNTITDMITVHDKDFNIIRANKAAEKILGLPLLEIVLGTKCFKYYHGKEAPPEGCPSCQCLKTGLPATFEIFEPHLNMFIEIRAIPRFDSNNNLIGLIHVVRDITERKKSEEEVNKLLHDMIRAKREWEITFDSASEIIMLVDKELTIIRANKSFADFAGIPLNKIVGQKYYDFFPSEPELLEGIRSSLQIEGTEVKTESGHWLYLNYRPIFDEDGDYLYSVVIATDITRMQHAQQRLMDSEKELQKRVEELEKFYEMAVGRELKMKELKKEIEILNAELKKYKNEN